VNSESSDSARKEQVYLDPVKDVECSVPVVRVLAQVQVDCVEDATEGDIAMEGRHKKPRAEEVSGDKACDPVPDLWRNALGGGDA
jgi:hypothetical protein